MTHALITKMIIAMNTLLCRLRVSPIIYPEVNHIQTYMMETMFAHQSSCVSHREQSPKLVNSVFRIVSVSYHSMMGMRQWCQQILAMKVIQQMKEIQKHMNPFPHWQLQI